MKMDFIDSDENNSKLFTQNKAIVKQVVSVINGLIDSIYFLMFLEHYDSIAKVIFFMV